jgi:Transferase family
MSSQSIVRIKPALPSTGSRIPLHAIDIALAGFIPLNLFFRPSSTSPSELQNFATSLQDVLDRLPLIAGSICDVEDAQGVKSKELVDDGRGAHLIWVDSPLAYADLHESPDVSPRTLLGYQEYSEDQPLLMVKFTKVRSFDTCHQSCL